MERLSPAVVKGLVIGTLLALPTLTNAAFESPQQAGQIAGKVVDSCRPGDSSGIWVYIPGRSFIAKTGTDGNFVLNYVPPGTHTIVLDLPPNPPQTIPNVTVSPSSVVNLGTRTIGTCVPGLTQTICPVPNVMCNGVCVNPATDPRNCGNCGRACATGQTCSAGVCLSAQTICPVPNVMCNGVCVNPATDPRNCGNCGRACATGQTCSAGVCLYQTYCPAGNVRCNGICVNPMIDPRNCGSCGFSCGMPQRCNMGACQ